MSEQWDVRNLGRQGPPNRSPGMWPNGEGARIRDAYDDKLRTADDGTTKICYACRGSGKNGKNQCSACSGSGSVPSAG